MRIIKINIVFLLFAVITFNGFTQEVRYGISIKESIFNKMEAGGKIQLRQSIGEFKYNYAVFQLNLDYLPTKNIAISSTVRYSVASESIEESLDIDLNEKFRYTLDLTLKTKRFNNDLRIKNRVRYQHSSIHKHERKDFIRNKLELDYKINKYLKPYVAIEPYFTINKKAISKGRIYIGNEIKIRKRELDLFFILEGKNKDMSLSTNHIIGLSFSF